MALAVPCSRVVAPATGVAKGNSTWREPRKADPLAVSEEVLGAFPFLLATGGVLKDQNYVVFSLLHGSLNFVPYIG